MECTSCLIIKPIGEFNFRNSSLGVRQKACKECTRARIRAHYYSNRDYYLRKARKRNAAIINFLREYIWKYLSTHHCIDCGENDPVVLEFDHKRDKILALSEIIKNSPSLKRVDDEILKCEVRCANCHRRKTSRERGYYRSKFAPVAQWIERIASDDEVGGSSPFRRA